MKKFFLAGLLLIGLVLYVTFSTSSYLKEQTAKQAAPPATGKQLPQLEFSQTKLTEVVDEKVNWELNSQSIIMEQEKNMVTFQKSRGVFYQEGKKALVLRAKKGYFDLEKKNIWLEGSVQVFSNKGEQLQAEKIQWVAEKKKLQGEGKVVFVRGNIKVTGDRFETDLALENMQITGRGRVLIGGN